ncbi:MAG: hypothetical protein QOK49_2648, partial [Baekduia sp.]|nr:hypothetical protein [Baekduia sp.]
QIACDQRVRTLFAVALAVAAPL